MSTFFKTFFSFKECHSFFKRKKRPKNNKMFQNQIKCMAGRRRDTTDQWESPAINPCLLSSDFQQGCQNHSEEQMCGYGFSSGHVWM